MVNGMVLVVVMGDDGGVSGAGAGAGACGDGR